jgi:hypothetical protein
VHLRPGGRQHPLHAVPADDAARQLVEHPADGPHRERHQREQVRDPHQLPGVDVTAAEPRRAGQQDREHAEHRQRLHDRVEQPADPPDGGHGVAQLQRRGAEALGLVGLPAEGLDDQGAVEGLVRDAADLAALLLGQRHQRRHPARVEDRQAGDGREDDRADQRQHRVGDEQQAERGDQHEDHADREGERRDRVPGRLDVAVGVGQQLAGRVLGVPGQRQLEVAPGHPRR